MNTTLLPHIGAGTFRLEGQAAYDSVKQALALGYRHIDTAQIYGNEAEVGQAITDSGVPRAEIFLTTKVWIENLAADKFLPSVKQSLAKLQTEYVDLLLIHWPSPNQTVPMTEYMAQLQLAKTQGLAKHIGVSNFTIELLQQAIDLIGAAQIATNQIEVHPYLNNEKLVAYTQAQGIEVTGFMPFAVGKALQDKNIQCLAERYQASPAQLILAWLKQRGIVTIPSSTKVANLKSNLSFEHINIKPEDMILINALSSNERVANPDFSPLWD